MPGNTYGHGVVEGVVVDTGSQGEIQHAALKELQGFRHLLMEILRGFVGAGKVQIVRVQPVRAKRGSEGLREWKNIYLHNRFGNSNQLQEPRERRRVCNSIPPTACHPVAFFHSFE